MTHTVDRERVIGLARAAVTSLAPEELPVFEAVSARVARDPDRGLDPGRTREDLLGFGIDVAVPLLTPVAIAVAAEVLRYVTIHLSELLHPSDPDVADGTPLPPRWTSDQLSEIHEVAYRKALASRLNDARSTALADAIVAALATAPD